MLRRIICSLLAFFILGGGVLAETVGVEFVSYNNARMRFDVLFDEAWFDGSSYVYNHELMRTSLVLTQASMGSGARYGEDGDFGREDAALGVFETMGFQDARAWHYDVSLNDTSDKAAFAIARRALPDGGALLLTLVRSGNYGGEWASNFHVGAERAHAGFAKAAEGVTRGIEAYISEYCPEARVKIWIIGYSRGAAVANLTAARLDDLARAGEGVCAPEDIYAYTFATPATVMDGGSGAEITDYANIFNIINYADVVPEMPLAHWGYTRYGATIVFGDMDARLAPGEAESVYAAASAKYRELTGRALDMDDLRALRGKIDAMLSSMSESIPDISSYVDAWEYLYMNLTGASSYMLNKTSLTEQELNELCEPYGDVNWTRLARLLYDGLSATEWRSGMLLSLLDRLGEDGALALSEASVLADALPTQSDTEYEYTLSYAALAMLNAKEMEKKLGGNRFAYFSRALMLSDVFMQLTDVFAGHMPDMYMAFLLTLSEDQLLNTTRGE